MFRFISLIFVCANRKGICRYCHRIFSSNFSLYLGEVISKWTALFFSPLDEAFLLSELHVAAMFQCLEAVEQNDARMLALINTTRVSAHGLSFGPVSNHML